MYGRRVRPYGIAAGGFAATVAALGIVLMLLVPSGLVGATSPPALPGAPLPGAAPVALIDTREALASLTASSPRTMVPDPWHNLSENASPSPREGEALVYDPAEGYVLLFGGATGAGAQHDTWTFANGRWTNLTPTLTRSPPSRFKAGVAYDAADGYVLVFGGHTSTYLNDTWKWEDGNWSEINTTTAPSAREDAMMAYDPADGYVVLFGGENVQNHLLNDTWTYLDGAWTNITASIRLSPPTREAGAMTWDSTDGYVLLFGGSNDPRGDLHDTWTFRGGVWTNRTNLSAPTPSKRETPMMADDPIDGFVLLFGGLKFPSSLADSWAYSNGSWTQLAVAPSPPAVWGGEATWDPNGGLGFVLLFGGVSSPYSNATYYNQTWTFKVPLLANLSASGPTEFDLGGQVTLSVAAQGGYPAYSYAWQGLPPGCTAGNASSLVCQPTSMGTFNVTASVTDLAGSVVPAGTLTLVVVPLPTVAGRLAPVDGDVPLRVEFNATVAGGTPPLTYDWQFGDGGSSNASSGSYLFGTPGVYTPVLTVVDADGARAIASGLPNITVKPALQAAIEASVVRGIVPLTVNFSSTVTGGWAPYQYAWQLGPAGVTSSAPTPSYTFLTPGSYLVSLNVTDSLGVSVVAFTNVTVEPIPPLVATATATPSSGTVPLNVTLTAGASGGTGPYTFDWSFGDGSPDHAGGTVTHNYTVVGEYLAMVTVTDSTGATAEATVVVNATAATATVVPFAATFTYDVGTAYCAAGAAVAAVTLSASATGGTGPYSFGWTVGTSTATGATATVLVPAGATTELFLSAADSAGHSATVTHNATVGALSCSTSSAQGTPSTDWLLILLIVVVAVVVAVEIGLLLRKR